ncbi:MAG TPA: hypothetical protein VG963_27355 [Polyangiaceae bacterium]|nr:hypothetical protein [Polyangiaceae bacterium]
MRSARSSPAGAWRAFGGIIAALLGSCSKPNSIHFRVTNAGTTEADRITELRVYAGAEKSSWPYVAPQESVSVWLDPGGDPSALTLSYEFHGEERFWRAPDLGQGIGYVIAVEIRRDGTVGERHCRRPCRLP